MVASAATLVHDPYLQQVLQTSAEARQAALELGELTAAIENTANPDSHTSTQQNRVLGDLAQLRGANRQLAHLVRSSKLDTSNSRAEIDQLHLQLQNLYYESRHLTREIEACEDFPHTYSTLPLVSQDDFLAQYVGDASQLSDEDIMKERIQHEYEVRVKLEEQRKALVNRKMELFKANAKRKEELVKLDKDLETFIDAARPIQKTFEKEY